MFGDPVVPYIWHRYRASRDLKVFDFVIGKRAGSSMNYSLGE